MRDAFTIATWCCRSWRVFDRSNPFRVAGEACTKARPSVGRLDSNQHPLALYQLSYTPDGRRSTRPPISGRRRRLRIGEAPAGNHPRTGGRQDQPFDPSTTESPRGCVHAREWFAGGAGFEPATYGSKDHRAANCTTRLHAGLRVHSLAGRRPPATDVTGTARHDTTMQRLLCHDKVDAAGNRLMDSYARQHLHA